MKTKVGIIGCGNISGAYLYNCYRIKSLELVALADMDITRAQAKVDELKERQAGKRAPSTPPNPQNDFKPGPEDRIPVACSVKELLANPEIQLVLNLTIPKAHAEVAIQCLEAGKHTYHEKPFGVNRDEGKRIMTLARSKKLLVGCAPDTFLGAGIQTCRKLIDDGWIGTPIGATAFMTCPGHESWHPDPEFYYEVGGGPMFDMGPYYLTALVNLLGPVKRVTGFARATYPERTITSAKKFGKKVKVETPTHITTNLEFASGALGTMLMSFDVFGANLPRIEIFGTNGCLSVPDPNSFGGPVKVKIGRNDWAEVPLTHSYAINARGLGAADMGAAIAKNRPHRANGDLAFHVLDIMAASLETQTQGKAITLETTVERPAPLPLGLRDGDID